MSLVRAGGKQFSQDWEGQLRDNLVCPAGQQRPQNSTEKVYLILEIMLQKNIVYLESVNSGRHLVSTYNALGTGLLVLQGSSQ